MIQKEDVDKIVSTIQESVPVYQDVDKALEDGKINLITEALPLVAKHSGKVLRLIQSAREIGAEVADLDPKEADLIMEEIAKAYGGDNEQAREGAKNIVVGLAGIRTGIVQIIESKKENDDEKKK